MVVPCQEELNNLSEQRVINASGEFLGSGCTLTLWDYDSSSAITSICSETGQQTQSGQTISGEIEPSDSWIEYLATTPKVTPSI
jgi:hypothetical protein